MVHFPFKEVLFPPVIYKLFYYGSIYPILHCDSVFPPFWLFRSRCWNLEFLSSFCRNKPDLKPQVCIKRLGPSYDWCQPTRNSSLSKWVAVLWISFIINWIDIIMMMIIITSKISNKIERRLQRSDSNLSTDPQMHHQILPSDSSHSVEAVLVHLQIVQ